MMLFLLAMAALAQVDASATYPPDLDCQEAGNGGTAAIAGCLRIQADIWERRLNVEYQAALKRREIDATKLRRAQRAWLRFREDNCDAYFSISGTIRLILVGRCMRDMTRSRTIELQETWTG